MQASGHSQDQRNLRLERFPDHLESDYHDSHPFQCLMDHPISTVYHTFQSHWNYFWGEGKIKRKTSCQCIEISLRNFSCYEWVVRGFSLNIRYNLMNSSLAPLRASSVFVHTCLQRCASEGLPDGSQGIRRPPVSMMETFPLWPMSGYQDDIPKCRVGKRRMQLALTSPQQLALPPHCLLSSSNQHFSLQQRSWLQLL